MVVRKLWKKAKKTTRKARSAAKKGARRAGAAGRRAGKVARRAGKAAKRAGGKARTAGRKAGQKVGKAARKVGGGAVRTAAKVTGTVAAAARHGWQEVSDLAAQRKLIAKAVPLVPLATECYAQARILEQSKDEYHRLLKSIAPKEQRGPLRRSGIEVINDLGALLRRSGTEVQRIGAAARRVGWHTTAVVGMEFGAGLLYAAECGCGFAYHIEAPAAEPKWYFYVSGGWASGAAVGGSANSMVGAFKGTPAESLAGKVNTVELGAGLVISAEINLFTDLSDPAAAEIIGLCVGAGLGGEVSFMRGESWGKVWAVG